MQALVYAGGDMLLLRLPGGIIWLGHLCGCLSCDFILWFGAGLVVGAGLLYLVAARGVLSGSRYGCTVPTRYIHVPAQPVCARPGGQVDHVGILK